MARLARRLARGSRFGGLDAPPLALLGGSAFGLGARPGRRCRRLASVGGRRARPRSGASRAGSRRRWRRSAPRRGARAAVRCGSRLRHTACPRRPWACARRRQRAPTRAKITAPTSTSTPPRRLLLRLAAYARGGLLLWWCLRARSGGFSRHAFVVCRIVPGGLRRPPVQPSESSTARPLPCLCKNAEQQRPPQL